MQVNNIQIKRKLSYFDYIKTQLLIELTINKKEFLIESDIELLTLLVISGPNELGRFCTYATKYMYKNALNEDFAVKSQNIRNRLIKLEKRNIILKTSGSKKIVQLSPTISISKDKNSLLTYNFLTINGNN